MEKLVRDGKVAVIYSPGLGAGWSTWGSPLNRTAMMFDPDLAEAVLSGDHVAISNVAKSKFPREYAGGLRTIAIEWIAEGTAFRISEYDGSESVETNDSLDQTA